MAYPGEQSSVAAPAPAESAPQPQENTQSEQAVEQSASGEPSPAEVQKLVKKFKLKVDGEELEEEFDLSNEEELRNQFQLARAAQKRMAEAAEVKKQIAQLQGGMDQFIQLLKEDPKAILTHPGIGVDLKKFAQEIINAEIEEQQKSPEQKEKEKLEKELREIKEKYENEKKTKEKEEFERLQAEQEEKITNDFQTALSEVKLPASKRALKYMAEYSALALQNGIDVPASAVAKLVSEQMRSDYKEMLKNSSDDVLEQFIDKEIEARLQKRRISKAPPKPSAEKVEVKKADKKQDNRSILIDDWLYSK